MLSDEEKKEYKELKSLLYQGTLTQYGKRKLIGIIEKQSKEIEELKEQYKIQKGLYETYGISKDKIKAKIEELDYNDIGNFERRCKQEVLQSLLEKE